MEPDFICNLFQSVTVIKMGHLYFFIPLILVVDIGEEFLERFKEMSTKEDEICSRVSEIQEKRPV